MLDATGKLSSGLLNGNVNQFGDFDECMELSHAQYCLADVDVKHLMTGPLERYKNRIHSHFAIVEDFTDVIIYSVINDHELTPIYIIENTQDTRFRKYSLGILHTERLFK